MAGKALQWAYWVVLLQSVGSDQACSDRPPLTR